MVQWVSPMKHGDFMGFRWKIPELQGVFSRNMIFERLDEATVDSLPRITTFLCTIWESLCMAGEQQIVELVSCQLTFVSKLGR